MNHQQAVELIQQEIDNGSARSDTLEDCLKRGKNLHIFLRRMVANNFCLAIVDLSVDRKPLMTWTFDLADCPIIFEFFKKGRVSEKIMMDTVRIAMDTLEQIRQALEVETELKDIIIRASEPQHAEDEDEDEGA